MKADMSQALILFRSENMLPRNPTDLNAAEHIGTIIKDELEGLLQFYAVIESNVNRF